MKCEHIRFSGHALRRMIEREIYEDEVLAAIHEGEVIADYPDDTPLPSVLVLHRQDGQPIHVVVAKEDNTGTCMVITVYRPNSRRWTPDFRSRRKP